MSGDREPDSTVPGLRTRLVGRVLEPAAQKGLEGAFDPREIRSILDEALGDYEAQRPGLPREESRGGRLMVHLAAMTIGLYRALLARDVDEERARELTARVTWRAYEKMASVPTVLSRIGSHSRRDRLVRATDLFRRFPFGAPAYEMIDVPADVDVVAFDVRRCPVAEHFIAQGLGALCVASWCDLDFPLAEIWGAELKRSTTIAGGGTSCDFRWRVRPDGEG